MEVVEIAHPEKIGVCSARVVLTEDLQEMAPFCDILTMGHEYESYQVGFFHVCVIAKVSTVNLDYLVEIYL